jgi:hypothetical protein
MLYASAERKGFQLVVTHGECHAVVVYSSVFILLVRAESQRAALDVPPRINSSMQVPAYLPCNAYSELLVTKL